MIRRDTQRKPRRRVARKQPQIRQRSVRSEWGATRTTSTPREEALLDKLEAAGCLERGTGDPLAIEPLALPPGVEPPSRTLARLRAHER